MKEINTVICGGDRRMLAAAHLFSKIGKCSLWRCASGDITGAERTDNLREAAKDAYVILPIPSFDRNGMLNGAGHVSAEELFRILPYSSHIFGAKVSALTVRLAKEHGHIFYDYGERDDFNILNAVPTAEAAILIAMEHSEKTVHNGNFTVIGYGRIGKALAARLSFLGGRVTVAARSDSALAAAESDGHKAVRLCKFDNTSDRSDVCFNTVPCTIFDKDQLCNWKCPRFIELASMPGGFTEDGRRYLSDRYICALSLPGRYFPETAGEIIYKTVLTMINSKGGL